ncbi:MAG: SGNH/GDSL hydrolase family protein [Lachnospiraceae bacterium]|nr:SGNH/GDSL hydrolase family protein [Lachnospiraceae bacterium]
MSKETKKRWLRPVISGLLVILILLGLQRLLVPKYMGDTPIEGAMIGEYYDTPKLHDVIFLGDCEVYENISPVDLWRDYGISSYVRGSAQQLTWQSYYLLEDTLRYETPKAVVFNVQALKTEETESEAYNRMTLDGMAWSLSKVKAIQASMGEDESMVEYVFPLLRFHSRYSELTKEDFTYFFHRDVISYAGYYMRVDVKAAGSFPEPRRLSSPSLPENTMEYLDKMRILCKNNGVELILMKAPSLYPHWYEEWDAQIEAYAAQYGLAYYNFLDVTGEIGLDYSMDTYDGGLHLNLSGAQKLAEYFGDLLVSRHHLPDRRGEATYQDYWKEQETHYDEGRNKLIEELKKNEKE